MKILHSADWHLGKNLEKHSRLEDQEMFLQDFCEMADEHEVNLIIVAGDVFDKIMPPIEAEVLLYKYLEKLSNKGERLILLIAGNHDSPSKIVSAAPLAMYHGIIMVGTPNTIVPLGNYGKHEVIDSDKGMVKVKINDETAVILTVPYVNESRLNEVFTKEMATDEEKCNSYNDRVKTLFTELSKHYKDDTINIATSHIFVSGSLSEGAERNLGGAYMCEPDCFPKEAQYIALGHIHKPLTVELKDIYGNINDKIRYSGSPLQYNKREIGYDKECLLVEVHPKQEAKITSLPITIHRPIEVWKFDSIEEAIETCEAKKDYKCYAYVEINSTTPISRAKLIELNSVNKHIIYVEYFFNDPNVQVDEEVIENFEDYDIITLYKNFYNKNFIVNSHDFVESVIDFFTSVVNSEEIPEVDIDKFKLVLDKMTTLGEPTEEIDTDKFNLVLDKMVTLDKQTEEIDIDKFKLRLDDMVTLDEQNGEIDINKFNLEFDKIVTLDEQTEEVDIELKIEEEEN